MSTNLADKLMSARSAEDFLREYGGHIEWQLMSALKSEVDRLVGCDLNAATRLTDRIEQLAALVDASLSKAFAEASRARVLHHLGHHSQASALYDKAVGAMRAARLPTEAAILQIHQVAVLRQVGRYDEALCTARAARRVLARREPIHLAQLETNVGNVYYRMDRYKKALEHYDRAREILATAAEERMLAVVDTNRAHILTEMDRPAEALSLFESAAGAMERTGQMLWAAQTRFHIAYLQFLRGNYNTALASYYQIRDRLAELGSVQLVAWCDLEIAEILLALNSFDDAMESAIRARSSFGDLGMPYESAQAALVRALSAVGLRQFEQAQDDLAEAREVFEESCNTTFVALVDCYLAELAIRLADAAEAARRAKSALRVFARQKLSTRSAYSRLLAARAAYASGDLVGAHRAARIGLRLVEGKFAPGVVYQCHHLMGTIERDRGRSRAALESFRSAVKVVEQMRGGIAADEFKATFLGDKIGVYEDAISACLDEGSEALAEEAFRLVESSKSRSLADLLAGYVRTKAEDHLEAGLQEAGRQGLNAETRARLLKLIQDLNWYSSHAGLEDEKGDQRRAKAADHYRQQVIRCEKQIAQLFRRLEAEGSAFAEMQMMQAADPDDLRNALKPGEDAIEYFTTGDDVSAFIASRERISVVRAIASKRNVEQLLAAFRFQIEKFNYGSDYVEAHFNQLKRATDEYLARLYEAIIAPLETYLTGDQIIVIPHGVLHYIPFHALRGRRGYLVDGYLVDRFELSYAPSTAVLKLCRTRNRQTQISNGHGRLVALGVAHHETPSIEEEIHTLGTIFPDAVTLRGSDATRDNLMKFAPEARFLHLASHGYFRRDNPMFSFLKLADSPLNFYSLLDLKLKAEMVTLSACHTGINQVFPGDELHGLMRGFLYAGAPSLVASLWAVSDRSTADLMREMYSRIREGDTKRAALRSAQLAIKDAYGHPYYWAPFVLMGDPV